VLALKQNLIKSSPGLKPGLANVKRNEAER